MATRRTLLACAIALSAQLALAGGAHADQLADIRKKGEIVFGVLGTDEPKD